MPTLATARRLALTAVPPFLLVACGVFGTPPGPDIVQVPLATPAPDLPPEIVEAISLREELGLRSDPGWVQAVAANPDVNLDWGIPLLAFEAAELERRATGESEVVGVVQAYLAEHADVNGGVYIDQRAGGVVTVLVTDDPAPHEAALRELAGADARIAVRQVQWTEGELLEFQERIASEGDAIAALPAFVTGTGVDVMGNRVTVDVSSAVPDVGQRIAALVGAEEGQLQVVSDGTGLLLLPTGRIEGRVIAPPGTDLTTLSPQFEADVPIGARDAIGIAVEPDGTFTIEDLPPTGYRVYLLDLSGLEPREAGETRVTVQPGAAAFAEIVYEGP